MRTIAHLSDLHFGREDPRVVEGLRRDLLDVRPDLVVASGDLTQRAKVSEFLAARAFLDSLPFPRLVVPGNHDLPLFDLARRITRPRARFRRFASESLAPMFVDEEMAVLGLDTTDARRWKEGEIASGQVRLIQEAFRDLPPRVFRVLVTHHPFLPPANDLERTRVRGAARALAMAEACGVDLLLAGHLHLAYTGNVRTFYAKVKRSMLVAQAGTAVSVRVRGEPNAYNVVRLDGDTIGLEPRRWALDEFAAQASERFERGPDGWRSSPARTMLH